MDTSPSTLDDVIVVIAQTLGIEDRAPSFVASTPLFGSVPELDSLAVLELTSALEERFDFVIDDDDFSGDIFETVGSLAAFVDERRG
jgi:acyl carrier protein